MEIIGEQQIKASQQWLFDNAPAIGNAKAELTLAEEAKKVIEAEIFLNEEGSIKERESKAKTHPRYREAMKRIGEASREYNTLMAFKSANECNIQIFQTQSANLRGLK